MCGGLFLRWIDMKCSIWSLAYKFVPTFYWLFVTSFHCQLNNVYVVFIHFNVQGSMLLGLFLFFFLCLCFLIPVYSLVDMCFLIVYEKLFFFFSTWVFILLCFPLHTTIRFCNVEAEKNNDKLWALKNVLENSTSWLCVHSILGVNE